MSKYGRRNNSEYLTPYFLIKSLSLVMVVEELISEIYFHGHIHFITKIS